MGALTFIAEHGLSASISESGKLRIQGLTSIPPEKASRVVEYARKHKEAIIEALSRQGEKDGCEVCPAAGFWDFGGYSGQGLLCFHYAYFLGKSGRPTPCREMKDRCPLKANP